MRLVLRDGVVCFASVAVCVVGYDIFVENVVGIGLGSKDKR